MQTNIPGLQTTDPGVHTIDPGVQTMSHYGLTDRLSCPELHNSPALQTTTKFQKTSKIQ